MNFGKVIGHGIDAFASDGECISLVPGIGWVFTAHVVCDVGIEPVHVFFREPVSWFRQ